MGTFHVAEKKLAHIKTTNTFLKKPKSVTLNFIKNVYSMLLNILDVQKIEYKATEIKEH